MQAGTEVVGLTIFEPAEPELIHNRVGRDEGPGKLANTVTDGVVAIGAYGGFFIPKSYGTSIAMFGGPDQALYAFIVFYLTCVALTWWFYSRRGAEIEC